MSSSSSSIQEKLNKKLLDAAKDNNLTELQAAVKEGADVNAKDECNETPLHIVARNGHKGCLDTLIKEGADVNAKDEYNETPLHIVARNGHTGCLDTLIKDKANLEAKNYNGFSPLHVAAHYGHKASLTKLVKAGAKLDSKANKGWTPLHVATVAKKEDCQYALIIAGANPLVQNGKRRTAKDVVNEKKPLLKRNLDEAESLYKSLIEEPKKKLSKWKAVPEAAEPFQQKIDASTSLKDRIISTFFSLPELMEKAQEINYPKQLLRSKMPLSNIFEKTDFWCKFREDYKKDCKKKTAYKTSGMNHAVTKNKYKSPEEINDAAEKKPDGRTARILRGYL